MALGSVSSETVGSGLHPFASSGGTLDPLAPALVDELELTRSLEEEMKAWRSLMPSEPWRASVTAGKDEIIDWVRARLLAGTLNSGNAVVSARKTGHGTRPVPVMGVAERITYRALALLVLKGFALSDRSPDAYRDFVLSPIENGFVVPPGEVRTLGGAIFGHVVEADITAFYQYVDHEVLRQELHVQTGRVVETEQLLQLLAECEGRTFGIPQLYDPSDWLSDYYASIVERDLIRRGFSVWRYNDDFRIGCKDYAEALNAIERLEEAARAVGLVVNTYKTYTPTFFTYFVKNTGLDVSSAEARIDPQDVEVILGDYSQLDESDALATAQSTIGRLEAKSDDDTRIDITDIRTDEGRDLRRAFGALTRNVDPKGLPWVRRLFQFVPALTPRLVQYLISLHGSFEEDVSKVLDGLRDYPSLSDWQILWIIHALRELEIALTGEAMEWLRAQRERGRGGLLGAEAALALSINGGVTFEELDQALRVEPDVLTPWYVLAVKSLGGQHGPSAGQLAAVKAMSPLHRCILEH